MRDRDVSWSFYTPENLSDRDTARDVLARLLRSGQLVLLLGAGASSELGLPKWSELVQRCADQLGDREDYSAVKSSGELMGAIDRLRRSHELSKERIFEIVRVALYGSSAGEAAPSHDFDAFRYPLLSALGALMMASARGSAGEVFTLNFDDILEWYLDLHGFSSEVVAELPATLRGDVDVHVYHIHGFVPLMLDRYSASSWLVLSQKELEQRLAKSASYPWEALLLNRLQTKVFLVVGTSMSDTDIKVSLARASESTTHPLGFVLGRHDADKVLELREAGMVPVHFDNLAEIPRFILEVCQGAARFR